MTAVLDRLAYRAAANLQPPVSPLGIVTALVAVTGVRDHVGDIITPGAFARTLRERKAHPRLLHNWGRQIGHTLDLRELLPGDPGLPRQAPDGSPWPRQAGALVARFKVDQSIQDGRRALAWAQGKLGAPPWYSIGYVPVNPRRRDDTRYLDDLDLWEYSMVHHPANGLAAQVDVKSLPNLLGSEHQLPPESIEVKVRYVRDASYWGYPVGTPITATMKPKGKTAVALRRAGRVPARTVGTTPEKPKQGARSAPVKPDEETEGLFPEPDVDARVRADASATGDVEGATTSLIEAVQDARYGDPDTAIQGLLHEGVTPAELEEDLRDPERWPASLHDDERADLIESALADYRAAYRTRAAQQAERRAAAAQWTPPSREAFDRIAAQASTELETFEEARLAAALADLGHDDPEGFAAHLTGPDMKLATARAELDAFLATQREHTESSGDIGDVVGDLSERDDEDLLRLRRDVLGGLRIDDDDAATITAAEAVIDAEIARRGIIAIGDVKPGDLFEFAGQRYYVAPDGGLIDPEGERTNLPRTAYRGRAAKLIERDAPAPLRAVDVEQLAATDTNVVAGAPATTMDPAEYHRLAAIAQARRARAANIVEEQKQVDVEAGYAAAADLLADAAPEQIDLDALRARRQTSRTTSGQRQQLELAGNGRLVIAGSGTKRWSIVTGSDMALVSASAFDEAKPPGKRALTDLANQLAALTDAQGRPAPFTATFEQTGSADRPDWVRGWRDSEGRSLPEAAAETIGAWAEQNNLTFRYPAGNYSGATPVPGGVPDADGFRTRRIDYLHREVAPGDEVRLPDGTVATVADTSPNTITLADGRELAEADLGARESGIGNLGVSAPIRFAGDPDDPAEQRDPGMGPIPADAAPPGIPFDDSTIEEHWPYEYDRPYSGGTRMAVLPATSPDGIQPRDNSARIGTLMPRLEKVQGDHFQTVRYDDGTFDQIRVQALRSPLVKPAQLTYVPNPSPEQVNAGRADWGLPPDTDAAPAPPPPAPQPPYVPPPKPAPVPLTPREKATRSRINQGPRVYGRWVRDTATDAELAEEESILLKMRSKMPIAPPSAARAFDKFSRNYVQPVQRERERRASRPAPEPKPAPGPTLSPLAQQVRDSIDAIPSPHLSNKLTDGALLGDTGIAMRSVAIMLHPSRAKKKRIDPVQGGQRSAKAYPERAVGVADGYTAVADALDNLGFGNEGDRNDGYGGISDYLRAYADAMRGSREPEPPTPEPPAPEPEPPPTVEIPADQLDEAAMLSDEVLGLLEQPDGSLEVTPEVGDRQDRVAGLLDGRDAGTLDLRLRPTEQLTGDRDDLRAELALQTALERRAPRPPAPRADGEAPRRGGLQPPNPGWGEIYAPRPGGVPDYFTDNGIAVWMFRRGQRVRFFDSAGNQVGPEQGNVAPAMAYATHEGWRAPPDVMPETTQRPGLVGAAQDHAEALRSGDPVAIAATKARLESSLRRSRAGSQAARQLADHVNDTDTRNDAERIEALANLIRAETRARRAAGARKRRTVRRLEREQVRSLLGEVEAELGARGTAKFEADLATLTALDAHRHDTAKQIGTMIAPGEMWIGGMGPYRKKRIVDALRVGDYRTARDRTQTLRDLHGDYEADLDPDIFRALDDAELHEHELTKAAPFPPATGGTAAKRAALNRSLLNAVQGLDPQAVKMLHAVQIERRRKIGDINADAWYGWETRTLSVATDLFGEAGSAQVMTRNETAGWFTTAGFEDYLTRSLHHEFGHHLHNTARTLGRERAMVDAVAAALDLPAPDAGESLSDWHKRHTAAIVDKVATYAGESLFELVAELWTEYRGRSADARPAAQAVGRVLGQPIAHDTVLPPVPAREPVAPPTPMSDSEYDSRVKVIESAIRAAIADGRATTRQHTVAGDGVVWLPERARQHREVIEALWSRGARVSNDGRAVLSGGLGGAGKGTVLKQVVDQNDYFTINSDDVKEELAARGMIPEVAGLTPMESVALVHEESNYLANLLAARAYAERKNVIWDVTMGSPGSTRQRVDDLRNAGYTQVDGIFVEIPVEVSVSRALARHRRGLEAHRGGQGHGGRFVPPEVIRAHVSESASSINREVFDGLRGSFDNWAIYDNSVYGRPPELIDGAGALAGRAVAA
jgi:predicted kinase